MSPDKQFIEFLVKLGATKVNISVDGTISATFPEHKPIETYSTPTYPEKIVYVPYSPDTSTAQPSGIGDYWGKQYITTGNLGYCTVKDSEVKDITKK